MNDQTLTPEERTANLKGMGCSRKRVEDARFTQGKGNYVDDIKLPGMLFGDFVRSPYAHARVTDINAEAALKVPGVLAVLTAKDLEPLGLHWMPTLAGDKQMVLADGKVLFQGQEVAYVVATDRYAASDGVEAVEVDYEELPAVTDTMTALDKDTGKETWRQEAGMLELAFGTPRLVSLTLIREARSCNACSSLTASLSCSPWRKIPTFSVISDCMHSWKICILGNHISITTSAGNSDSPTTFCSVYRV